MCEGILFFQVEFCVNRTRYDNVEMKAWQILKIRSQLSGKEKVVYPEDQSPTLRMEM